MGYSRSAKTVENRRSWLGPLMEGKPTAWTCKIGEEQDLAYQVRECLFVARCNPGMFPGLDLAKDFVVEASPERVTAREKIVMVPTTMQLAEGDRAVAKIEAVADPTKHIAGEITRIGKKKVMDIAQDWITAGSRGILHCPQAGLSREELVKLHRWAQGENVLIFWNDPMVTVRAYDEALAPHAFNPESDL